MKCDKFVSLTAATVAAKPTATADKYTQIKINIPCNLCDSIDGHQWPQAHPTPLPTLNPN